MYNFDRYLQSDEPVQANTHSQNETSPTPPFDFENTDTDLSHPVHSEGAQALKERYPDYDLDSLSAVLASCDGSIDAASAMLEGNTNPTTANDSAIASELQRNERRRARHRRNNARITLEKPVMDELVGTLREIVVPSLRAHFEELTLPDMRDDSAKLVYRLEQCQVTSLSLPSDNVTVRAAADMQSVYVNVINTYLEVQVGHWSYENRGLVPVKDSGRATASIHGLNIALRLEPRWSHAGGTTIVIVECTVTVDGVARFKTHGTAADWAYNTIAVLFKPLVVSYIKEAVSDAVTSALAVHLRQWAFAHGLDSDENRTSQATNASQEPLVAAE